MNIYKENLNLCMYAQQEFIAVAGKNQDADFWLKNQR